MNKLVNTILFLSFLFLSFKAWSLNTALYLSDKTRYPIEEAGKALARVIHENSKAVLIFVHGRGKHPQKGLEMLPELEKRYAIRVIMFHWDSWINPFTRPTQNAEEAGADLLQVLMQLDDFKHNNPQLMKTVGFSMMAHSMGSIVVESMLKEYAANSFSQNLFKNLIINQSDSEAREHSGWLSRADFQKNLFVTFSNKDSILKLSQKLDPGHRLGLGLRLKDETKKTKRPIFPKTKGYFPWAAQANYMNFTKVTKKLHNTYLPKQKEKYKTAIDFFKNILGSKNYKLTSVNNIFKKKFPNERLPHPLIYELRKSP